MKKILLPFFITLLSIGAKAQIVKYGVQNSLFCTITFAYDAGGNRISREFKCKDWEDPSPNDNPPPAGRLAKFKTIVDSAAANVSTINATIYPNPTMDKFTISFTQNVQNCMVTITDLLGKVIITKNVNGSTAEFNLSNYASGLYIATIKINNSVLIRKISLQQ